MSGSDNTGQTTFDDKCNILADLWMNYRYDEQFEDFIEYNDLGLPLSYLLSEGIVKASETATAFIDETFSILLEALEIDDNGFDTLDDLLEASSK